ncbi:hypothetical protein HNV08_00585 [Winogradskyella eckloniae]|uniref:hypothetical protein n=1 Tax=Winogradskyella eckloniae TaxID=1089306 RepID=UPI001564EE94|nr:hypothetical protein [Winogradskyella eckloniae]NRD18526.1 hypothetical protein [Winogradskyella eckloniae]
MSLNFLVNAKEDFFVLNYSWNHLQNQNIGSIKILEYEVNKFKASTENTLILDNQKTYVVDNKHYFRSERIETNKDTLTFIGVHWINEYPRRLEGDIKFGLSNLVLNQKEGISIAMIGDSQMGWREGKYTRKWISEKLNVRFVGNKNDVFGFPYYFENSYTSNDIFLNNLQFNETEIVILYLGLSENREDFETNLKKFVALNEEKEIIIIHNTLVKAVSSKLHYINISEYNKSTYFTDDGIHLNYKGHHKLAQELIAKLILIGVEKN